MRKIKNVFYALLLLLVLVLSVACFAACGNDKPEEEKEPEKPSEDNTPSTPDTPEGIAVTVANLPDCKIGDTITPTATVKENGQTVNVSITFTVTDPEGNSVALDGGKFKAMILGKYTVKASVASGESDQKTMLCKPAQTQSLAAKVVLGENRNKQIVYFSEAVEEVIAITYGGEEVEFTLEGNKAILETGELEMPETGRKIVSFVRTTSGEYRNYSQNFEIAQWAIGNADELSDFGDAVAEKSVFGYNSSENPVESNKPQDAVAEEQNMGLCVLTDDIDYKGEDFNDHTQKHNFYGTLDGRGHTIYNMKSYRGLFFSVVGVGDNSKGLVSASVIKNLALVNFCTTQADTTGGLLAYAIGFVNIDNCYFQGTITSKHEDSSALGNFMSSYMAKGSEISNVVIHVEYTEAGNSSESIERASVSMNPRQNALENIYCISSVANTSVESAVEDLPVSGLSGTRHNNGKYKNIFTYATYDEFKQDVTQVPFTVNEYANPNGYFNDYWTMYEGVLMFKSTAALIDKFNAEDFTFTTTAENGEAYAGEELPLICTKHNVLYKLEGLNVGEDYIIEAGSGAIKLSDTVDAGAEFTVKAYYVDAAGEVHESNVINFTVAEKPTEPTQPDESGENTVE